MNNSGFEEERDNSNETGRIDDAIRGRGVVRRSTRTRATVRDTDTAENPLRTGTRFIIERPFKTDSFWNNQTIIRFFSYSVGDGLFGNKADDKQPANGFGGRRKG